MTEVLPAFELLRPGSLDDALAALARPGAEVIAGGTDKMVQLRRGLADPAVLVDISAIAKLKRIDRDAGGWRIGAGVTLGELAADRALASNWPSVAQAARAVAAPGHRSVATLGGNLCLDTRCLYYNQSAWWRAANDHCLKTRGTTCHVAPRGRRCRAAYSGDLAPALMVHAAEVELAGPAGIRRLPLADFYREDGADWLALERGEIVTAVHLPPAAGPSAYAKLRLRGAIDFPLAGVAVARRKDGVRVALTGTNSCPVMVPVPEPVTGDDAWFAALGKAVQKAASPQRTGTVRPHYRRLAIAALAERLARRLADTSGGGG